MNSQLWSWILTIIGLTGFFLAGRKVWWCWYVNIANQVIWAVYSVLTQQWGFLVGVAAYSFVFGNNAAKWTMEHRDLMEIKKRWFDASVAGGTIILNNHSDEKEV